MIITEELKKLRGYFRSHLGNNVLI